MPAHAMFHVLARRASRSRCVRNSAASAGSQEVGDDGAGGETSPTVPGIGSTGACAAADRTSNSITSNAPRTLRCYHGSTRLRDAYGRSTRYEPTEPAPLRPATRTPVRNRTDPVDRSGLYA